MKECIVTLNSDFEYIKNSQEIYSSKYNIPLIREDYELPDIYENIKYKNILKKIFLIKKYLDKYDRVLWLDNTSFVTSNCRSLFKIVPLPGKKFFVSSVNISPGTTKALDESNSSTLPGTKGEKFITSEP